MGMTWTTEQQNVIDLRNRSMLVSAAAGSGKTAVLVQRLIALVTDETHPIDIDRLLVVTFTNAAAAEMRERVGRAIEEALAANPENLHLQRQRTLVHHAQITTIDSFCLNVIRNHFHQIDLEPGFRIADEGELKLLREDVCDAVLEEFYAKKDPDFLRFADSYSSAKSDEPIREMLLKLYDYSVSYPWPEEWLDSCARQYEAPDGEAELTQKPWMRELLDFARVRLSDLLSEHERLLAITRESDGPAMYAEALLDDIEKLSACAGCVSYTDWHRALDAMEKWKAFKGARGFKGSKKKQDAVKAGRERFKKQVAQLKKYFAADPNLQLERLNRTGQMVETLLSLTRAFARAFAAEKAKKNLLDFSDMEHFALRILIDPETKEPTQTAREYREQFYEVMIDEYQDSNYVQETLLRAVSGIGEGRENMLMVGDVKQSIYRFRLARPELFMEKYQQFSPEDGVRQRIDLHKNFRSCVSVVDTVNDVFERIMGEDLGRVEYSADAALYPGAAYEEGNAASYETECMVLLRKDFEDVREAEARAAAKRIYRLAAGQEIPGLSYRDIVILLRSPAGWAETYQRVFEEEGIPLIVASKTGYFSAGEVQTLLSFLRILDNPCQDIPLAAVLRSPIGGFSAEELSELRTQKPELPFHQCAAKLAEEGTNEKLTDFFKLLESFRERIPYTPIHRLIQEILDETGYLRYVTALPAGAQRRANLDMLLEKAIAYEKTSYHGLFHFIRYIDRQLRYSVDYGEAETIGEQEDAVRLMSIHASKGLEFPVVLLGGMGKQFNEADQRTAMIFHPEYGIGLRYYDCEKRTKCDTLIHQAFALLAKRENLGEELRVLYVALTRAKEKLILLGAEGKAAAQSLEEETGRLSFSSRYDAKCYWDWVLPALACCPEKYPVQLVDAGYFEGQEALQRKDRLRSREEVCRELETVDQDLYEALDRRLSWVYPYAELALKKQKVSVSELKHRASEEAEAVFGDTAEESLFPEKRPLPYLPKFAGDAKEEVGVRYGTAMHRFLACVDFEEAPKDMEPQRVERWVREQRDALRELGRMREEETQRLSIRPLAAFLGSDTAQRMKRAADRQQLTREQPFVMSMPAHEVLEDAPETAEVLVQGIIDAFWEEEDGIVLLDYKTDRVACAKELTERYQGQLALYAEALRRNFPGRPVKEALIYSFRLGETIRVETGASAQANHDAR